MKMSLLRSSAFHNYSWVISIKHIRSPKIASNPCNSFFYFIVLVLIYHVPAFS